MSKTHVIDGVTYVEVDRKAKVGDLIACCGMLGEFRYTDGIYNFVNYGGSISGKDAWYVEGCIVIEPLESEEPTPSVTVLLANLARRVSSLEQQLRDTQGNVEKLAEELATKTHELDDKVEMALDDIVTLDERSQVLNAVNKHYGGDRR